MFGIAASTIFGALVNWVPDMIGGVTKYFQDKSDKKHELELLEKVQQNKTERVAVRTDADEMIKGMDAVLNEYDSARQHDLKGSSVMTQLLEATTDVSPWVRGFVLVGFASVEMLRQSVRPVLAYVAEGLWVGVKWANVASMKADANISWAEAAKIAWSYDDAVLLATIVGFYFGGRVKAYAEAKWQERRAAAAR